MMKSIFCVTLFLFTLLASGQQGKNPYTSQPGSLGDTYRFVVVGDLTGGEIPGLFSYAVDRINELAPDFVITVGDLIEGYTSNKSVILGQWKDFHQRIQKLDAPFYYLAGNHDVGNPVLQAVWDSIYGRSHYTFRVNKDLFIVLNTFEAGKAGISPAQFDMVRKALQSHPASGRVFVFSHGPLWRRSDDFIALLEGREAYYFCGHEHHYIHKKYKSQDHYMLAGLATGDVANDGLGLFHNLMYVTVMPSQVHLSNMKLEGLLSPSVVDDFTEKQVNMLMRNDWAKITPTILRDSYSREIKTTLTVRNDSDYPLSVTAEPAVIPGLKIRHIDGFEVAAGKTKMVDVTFETTRKLNVDSLPKIGLRLAGRLMQPGRDISAEVFTEWVVDEVKRCSPATNHYIYCVNPGQIDEDWDWSGLDDGSFAYQVYSDKDNIHVYVKTTDDKLVRYSDHSPVTDKVSICFSPDTAIKSTTYAAFDFIPGSDVVLDKKSTMKSVTYTGKCSIDGNAMEAYLKISRKHLKNNSFRINFSFTDADDTINLDPSVIWWKPRWGSRNDYVGAGVFLIE